MLTGPIEPVLGVLVMLACAGGGHWRGRSTVRGGLQHNGE